MPEYIVIPKNVVTTNDLIRFVSKKKNLPYEEAKKMIMSPGDLGDKEFLVKHELIVARDEDVCAGYKLVGKRHERQNIYFKEGQVVALRTENDVAKPISSRLKREYDEILTRRKVFVSFC